MYKARLYERFMAFFMDIAFISILSVLILAPFGYINSYIDYRIKRENIEVSEKKYLSWKSRKNSIVLYLWIVSNIFFEYKYGRTIGKRLFNIKVIGKEYTNITFIKIIIRNLIKPFSIGLLGLGIIPILFSKDKQAIHDYFTKMLVVKK